MFSSPSTPPSPVCSSSLHSWIRLTINLVRLTVCYAPPYGSCGGARTSISAGRPFAVVQSSHPIVIDCPISSAARSGGRGVGASGLVVSVACFALPSAFVVVVVVSAVAVECHILKPGTVTLQCRNRVAQLSLRRVVWFSDAGFLRNCLWAFHLNLVLAVLVR